MTEHHKTALAKDSETPSLEQRCMALEAEKQELLEIIKQQHRMLLLARDTEIGLRVTLLGAQSAPPPPPLPQLTLVQRVIRLPITLPRRVYRRMKRAFAS